MYRKIFLLFVISISCHVQAQSGSHDGLKFENGLSWEEIKQKAKLERKFIFVDCYATWCKPCKAMDRDVYANARVGNYVNNKFIAIKVQLDTSSKDNFEIKRWYATAYHLHKSYKVVGLPTYLFFSPDGEIVHRGTGYKGVNDFIELASNAVNEDRQYYTLLNKYNRREINHHLIPYLAHVLRENGESKFAINIAREYIRDLLLIKKIKELLPNEVKFMKEFTVSSNEQSFEFFYDNEKRVDKIMATKGFSRSIVDKVITNEYVQPMLESIVDNNQPNWNKLTTIIKKKYNGYYAKRIILYSKTNWYFFRDQQKFINNSIRLIKKYGGNDFSINNAAWTIFLNSNEKKKLKLAINWMKEIISRNDTMPNFLDTYANLYYKLGLNAKAISIQERAVLYAPKGDSSFMETLTKMKLGKQTWVSINKRDSEIN
jgi:thioredoxin-related protein